MRVEIAEFKANFHDFYPKLMALACRFVDEHIAADLVQDTFASYWEQRTKIEAKNILSYLFKSLQNKCLDYLRHRMVEKEFAARVHLAEARINYLNRNDEDNDILKQVLNNNLRDVIEESIKKLPPRCAEVFRLCYLHDMSHKEIAQIMQISPRTVETHIRQAILFLREDLRPLFLLVLCFAS